MKRLSKVLLALCLLGMAGVVRAQQAHVYAVIDYMHIPEGKSDQDYIAIEKLWQRIHQKAADAGISQGWYLDRVENGGRNDFVTVRVYDSLNKIADPWPDSLIKGLFNSQEEAQMRKTGDVRHLTHSELWEIEASVLKKLNDDPKSFTVINFMKPKPGKTDAYYDMEKNLFSKVHKARLDAGVMDGWLFLSRTFPHGYDTEYDFITADFYADKATSEKAWDEKMIEKALTKEEIAKATNPEELRTIVRQEVWHPVLRAVSSKN